jgi:hypothetical protein
MEAHPAKHITRPAKRVTDFQGVSSNCCHVLTSENNSRMVVHHAKRVSLCRASKNATKVAAKQKQLVHACKISHLHVDVSGVLGQQRLQCIVTFLGGTYRRSMSVSV